MSKDTASQVPSLQLIRGERSAASESAPQPDEMEQDLIAHLKEEIALANLDLREARGIQEATVAALVEAENRAREFQARLANTERALNDQIDTLRDGAAQLQRALDRALADNRALQIELQRMHRAAPAPRPRLVVCRPRIRGGVIHPC